MSTCCILEQEEDCSGCSALSILIVLSVAEVTYPLGRSVLRVGCSVLRIGRSVVACCRSMDKSFREILARNTVYQVWSTTLLPEPHRTPPSPPETLL